MYLIVIVNERDDNIIKHILKLFVFIFCYSNTQGWLKLIFIGGPEIEDYIKPCSLIKVV